MGFITLQQQLNIMFRKKYSTAFRFGPYPGIAIGIRTDDWEEHLAKDEDMENLVVVKSRLTTIMIPMLELGIETVTVSSEKEEYVDSIIKMLDETDE